MKKICYILLILGLALTDATAQVNESEPNNSFLTANAIALGVEMKGTINPKNDDDYYKVTLTKPGVLRVSVENVAAEIQPVIQIYDAASNRLDIEVLGKGKNNYAEKTVCGAGTYFVLINSNSSSHVSTTPYSLKVILDETDQYECNNSFVDAKEFKDGETKKITIADERDVDYFKFKPTRTGVLRISLENVPAEIAPRIEIFNSANQRIEIDAVSYGKNIYSDATLCSTETYYFAIYSNSSGDKSPKAMDLKAVLDVADVFECNNTFTEAKEIQSGVKNKIAIGDERDADYFKIDVTKPGVIQVSAENVPAALAIRLRIYNAANQEIEGTNASYAANAYVDQIVCDPGHLLRGSVLQQQLRQKCYALRLYSNAQYLRRLRVQQLLRGRQDHRGRQADHGRAQRRRRCGLFQIQPRQ